MPVRRKLPPILFGLAAATMPAGCVSFHTVDDGIVRARLGETRAAGLHAITPQRLIEDSRCPAGTQCIRAGTVRLAVLLDNTPIELALDQPVPHDGGWLALVEAYPPARAKVTRYPDEYRFGFRWTSRPAERGAN